MLLISPAETEDAGKSNDLEVLLSVSNTIAATRNKKELFNVLHDILKVLLPFNDIKITCVSGDSNFQHCFIHRYEERRREHPDFDRLIGSRYPVRDGVLNVIMEADEPVLFAVKELVSRTSTQDYFHFYQQTGVQEIIGMAMRNGKEPIGCLFLTSEHTGDFKLRHLSLVKGLSSQLSIAVANILANEEIERQFEEIKKYKQQLEVENLYLQEEIQTTFNYSEIVGDGPAMQKVFELVSQVSKTASSVLILGETGTGKELIARAIHNTSLRKNKLMVKVNCATLPADLIESELFGHERGSFTGATDRRIGKFELADKSTLFLDEVGELPPGLQVKLLRALQEKEIERIGGKAVIRTDVRVIAATNRNLLKEVQEGRFRSDLYFRLNVFPITLPPLRQRKEDIPMLAAHFLAKYAKKCNRGTMNMSSRAIKELAAYNWPGNVRELEHLIERSILLTRGMTIHKFLLAGPEEEATDVLSDGVRVRTINEIEREHILAVLKMCNGKVSGIGGAAEALQIPSTTLNSKIRRLKIRKTF